MRPFYISKRSNGYYRVCFVDSVTKKMTVAKSTHKKTYDEALAVVCEWLQKGVPTRSKLVIQNAAYSSVNNNLQILNIEKMSDEQAFDIFKRLQVRFGKVPTANTLQVSGVVSGNSIKLKRDIGGEKLAV